jgi:excisionase family DNA binding protein
MVAERWSVSERHIRNIIASGELPSFRVGGKLLRIRMADVEAFECRGGSPDCEASSPSPSTEEESVIAIRSTPMIRAKLNGLRQPSMRS